MRGRKFVDIGEVVRTIQKTGKSTYIISLPKKWVEEHGLSKGSRLLLTIMDDGSIKVEPFILKRREFRKGFEVNLELSSGDVTSVERLLIAYYEAGYDKITVVQRPYMAEELRRRIRRALLRLSGLEIVEESSDHMILQSIIDASQIPVSRTLGRMENIVRSMLNDIVKGVGENNTGILQSIVERDNELDKFYFFLGRQVALALREKRIHEIMGFKVPVLALPYKTYGKCLEEMGDTLVSLTRFISSNFKTIKENYSRILEVLGFLERGFEYSVKAFREDDEDAGKAVSNLYTSFFLSFEQDLYKPNVIVLSASRFLSLCIDVIEAHVEKKAIFTLK
ncbi:MAG: phosphate uptake regulator PhoU [Thermoproteales archaeon]|nr:phosphate uptake regulator PhoU [Thermoproteales archaeon]